MKLVQTQNPNIIPLVFKWWRKYLSKIRIEIEEGEVNRLAEAFRPDGETRFCVLVDEKKDIHGFATVFMDQAYGALFVMQVATDKPREMHRELTKLAEMAGATGIYFVTERNPQAWERLLGAKQVGYMMELPFKEA